MPCHTEPESDTERESRRLNGFLDEAGEPTPRTRREFSCISRELSRDQMTAWLCEWCQRNDVTQKSLELQIWWRDHQAWDARRKAKEQQASERARLRAQAIHKLSPEERAALGVR